MNQTCNIDVEAPEAGRNTSARPVGWSRGSRFLAVPAAAAPAPVVLEDALARAGQFLHACLGAPREGARPGTGLSREASFLHVHPAPGRTDLSGAGLYDLCGGVS